MATQRTPLTILSWLVWRADSCVPFVFHDKKGVFWSICQSVWCTCYGDHEFLFWWENGGGGWVDWYIGGVVIYCLFIPYSFCTVGFVTIHFHIKLCWMLVCFINIHFIFHICWCLQSWYTIQVIKPLLRTRELRKRMFNTVILPISDQELNPHSQARHCSIQTFKVVTGVGQKVIFF